MAERKTTSWEQEDPSVEKGNTDMHQLLLSSAQHHLDVMLELALQVWEPAPNGAHLLPLSLSLALSLSLSECVSVSAAVFSIEKLPANVMNHFRGSNFR